MITWIMHEYSPGKADLALFPINSTLMTTIYRLLLSLLQQVEPEPQPEPTPAPQEEPQVPESTITAVASFDFAGCKFEVT